MSEFVSSVLGLGIQVGVGLNDLNLAGCDVRGCKEKGHLRVEA